MNIMILDLNQVLFSNMYQQLGNIEKLKIEQPVEGGPLYQIDEDMLRHMVLNSIRMLRVQFRKEYPELVIACDGQRSWRREIYPYYKYKRRKEKDTSQIAWNALFNSMTKIRCELATFFPYRVVYIPEAEADDIIATVVQLQETVGETLIFSADRDFLQLHSSTVKQYDPVRRKAVINKNPKEALLYHILRGDSGDGVPNVVSDDDCFATEGKRQVPLTGKRIKVILENLKNNTLDETIKKNIERNNKMINLKAIPKEIKDKIFKEYLLE